MWRDVFLHNKDAVLEMLGRFSEDSRRCSGRSAGATATSCSSSSPAPAPSAARIIEAGQEIDVPDFGRQAVEHPAGGTPQPKP